MSTSEPKPPPCPSEESTQKPTIPWRFSLRSLFGVTTVSAVLLAFGVVMPASLSWIANGAIWIVAAGWLVIGMVYGRGDQRAFCIGAALVMSSVWTGVGGRYMQGFHMLFGAERLLAAWVDLVVLGATAILNGIFCVFARRYFEGNGE